MVAMGEVAAKGSAAGPGNGVGGGWKTILMVDWKDGEPVVGDAGFARVDWSSDESVAAEVSGRLDSIDRTVARSTGTSKHDL